MHSRRAYSFPELVFLLLGFLLPTTMVAQPSSILTRAYDIRGRFAGDKFGGILRLTADFDGDGVQDPLVGGTAADSASGANDDIGVIQVVSGATGTVLSTISGSTAGDQIGSNFADSIPDVTGDGTRDILIISPLADGPAGEVDVGELRVISGSDLREAYRVYGDFAGDRLGSSGHKIFDDLTGDGLRDIVVGSWQAGDGASGVENGAVWAIRGTDGSVLFKSSGPRPGDQLSGKYFGQVPDMDLDRTKELVIVGTSADNPTVGADQGLVRVVSGASGAVIHDIYGPFSGDRLATDVTLSRIGDVSGDHIIDIAVVAGLGDSAEGAGDDVGLFQVISGASGEVLYSLRGKFTGDNFSQLGTNGTISTFRAVDLDRDGFRDIFVCSRFADSAEGANDDVGAVTAVSARTGQILWEFTGTSVNERMFPAALNGSLDYNGDLVNDYIMKSQFSDGNIGMMTLIDGRTGATIWRTEGSFPGDFFFNQYSRHFDLDADGFPEYLTRSEVASSEVQGQRNGAYSYISGRTGEVLWTNSGAFTEDRLGNNTVTRLIDVNRDGLVEFIVGSKFADSSEAAGDDVGLLRAISGVNGETLYEVRGRGPGDQLMRTHGIVFLHDLTGDTVTDFLAVAELGDSSPGANDDKGYLRVINARTGRVITDIQGDFTGDRLGSGTVLTRDLNADGSSDILIASPLADSAEGAGDDVGLVRVILTDACRRDDAKTAPGQCGCGTPDVDINENQIVDCHPNDGFHAVLTSAIARLSEGPPSRRKIRSEIRKVLTAYRVQRGRILLEEGNSFRKFRRSLRRSGFRLREAKKLKALRRNLLRVLRDFADAVQTIPVQ